jgi:hypothetical protein
MATYTLISSNVLTTATASVTFSSIPATYTDLVVRWSARSAQANATTRININLNGVSGTSYSFTKLQATGTSASSANISGFDKWWGEYVSANNATSNTFGSGELYLPNYLSTVNKPASFFSVAENNTTANGDWYVSALASLATITSAITSVALTLNTGDNFMTGSSFYLYGISNA